MGKLFVIEGIDGSGKSTQVNALVERLKRDGRTSMHIRFPQYDQPSSALLRMYLSGEFGSHPSDVNAFAASTFFAVDRYAAYKKDWGKDYENGATILSDRYVSSNLIHQGSKLEGKEALEFFDWLYDFEFDKLGLPRPDAVLFLDVPPSAAVKQVEKRYDGDETKKDIHEKDLSYLEKCYKTAIFACDHGYMRRIECLDSDGNVKSVDEIADTIYEIVKKEF